jgi:hypothetical protein
VQFAGVGSFVPIWFSFVYFRVGSRRRLGFVRATLGNSFVRNSRTASVGRPWVRPCFGPNLVGAAGALRRIVGSFPILADEAVVGFVRANRIIRSCEIRVSVTARV